MQDNLFFKVICICVTFLKVGITFLPFVALYLTCLNHWPRVVVSEREPMNPQLMKRQKIPSHVSLFNHHLSTLHDWIDVRHCYHCGNKSGNELWLQLPFNGQQVLLSCYLCIMVISIEVSNLNSKCDIAFHKDWIPKVRFSVLINNLNYFWF